MKPKTISIMGGIAMAGLVVITGASATCIQDGELIVHPTVVIGDRKHKVCFELEDDYQIFKQESFRRIHDNPSSENSLGYFGESSEANDEFGETILMLIEEIERGNIDMTNIDLSSATTPEEVFALMQARLKSEIDDLVDGYGFVQLPDFPDSPFTPIKQ